MRERSRRAVLAGTVPVVAALSGCSKLAKAGVKGADDAAGAAKGADEAADGARRADGLADDAQSVNEADEAKKGRTSGKRTESLVGREVKREIRGEAIDEFTGDDTPTATSSLDFDFPLYDIDDRFSLDPGEFAYWELDTAAGDSIAVELSYTVVVHEGSDVDVMLLDPDEFDRYRRGESFRYLTDSSTLGTSFGVVDTALMALEYRLVVDNTRSGAASMPEPVDVSIDCTVTG